MRELFRPGTCLALPGVFDGISARVADSLGFSALYMTGYGAVASALTCPALAAPGRDRHAAG